MDLTSIWSDISKAVILLIMVVCLSINFQIQLLPYVRSEQPHGTMQMEQFAQRSGKMNEVLHDSRIMMEVNSYNRTDNVNNSVIHDSTKNKSLVADLSIRNIDHILKVSPNLFVLNIDGEEITPSSLTSYVVGGLRPIYLPENQTIRTLLIFEHPGFGVTAPTLKYSDGSSSFSIQLVPGVGPKSKILGLTVPQYKAGEKMQDNFVRAFVNISSTGNIGKFTDRSDANVLKISLLFQNIGNSSVRIDPSYIFIMDNKSYVYGIDVQASNILLSPLRTVDLGPGKVIKGDVIVDVPKDSTNLIFMYASPNDSFIARAY